MNGLSTLLIGFQQMFANPMILVLLVVGVLMGIVFGSIPGLTGALAISLVLPFTYHMAANDALALLIAIYVGSISGGLISAILLNIPGTPSSIVTCFDGAPMARAGKPSKALVIGTFSSLIGGIFGGLIMVLISGPMATFSLKFGYWEYFSMGIMGLCIVVSLTGKDPIKGYISVVLGVFAGMVGTDAVSTVTRFTFGQWQLTGGFSSLPVLMGLFAISEIVVSTRSLANKAKVREIDATPLFPKLEWLKGTGKTMVTSSIIGTIIGILPGIGQATASLLAYTTAKQNSKTPEKFGTGCSEGVVASEAANNAVCGGALIPMMAIGIPGDVITSILLGALVMHGLQPGSLLFNSNPQVVGVIFAGYILANILMYVLQLGLMRAWIRILKVPLNLLYPLIIAACMVGGIATNNRVFDAGVLTGFGIVAYLMVCNDYPLAPMVLGYVLSGVIEKNFRTAMIATNGSFLPLFHRPIALVLLGIGLLMAFLPLIRSARAKRLSAKGIKKENFDDIHD